MTIVRPCGAGRGEALNVALARISTPLARHHAEKEPAVTLGEEAALAPTDVEVCQSPQ